MVRHAVCLATGGDIAPCDGAPVPNVDLHGKVVRVGAAIGDHVRIDYDTAHFMVPADRLRPVEAVRFDAGQKVLYKGEPARVRDVLWHFKDNRPNYYVTQAGKKVSKRLTDRDLEPDE